MVNVSDSRRVSRHESFVLRKGIDLFHIPAATLPSIQPYLIHPLYVRFASSRTCVIRNLFFEVYFPEISDAAFDIIGNFFLRILPKTNRDAPGSNTSYVAPQLGSIVFSSFLPRIINGSKCSIDGWITSQVIPWPTPRVLQDEYNTPTHIRKSYVSL